TLFRSEAAGSELLPARFGIDQSRNISRGKIVQTTATKQVRENTVSSAVVSAPEQRMPPATPRQPAMPARISVADKKSVGYGLPCSRCHAYYPSDMHACPICKSPDRVSASAPV